MSLSYGKAVVLLVMVIGMGGCAGKQDSLSALIKALEHTNPEVRVQAADQLGAMGLSARQALPALVAALKDSHGAVYRAAASAVSKMGDEALDELIRSMEDKNAWFRCRIAETLGLFGPAAGQAVPILMKALRDHDLCIQKKAGESLGKIGEESVGPLLEALKSTNPVIRKGAAKALEFMSSDVQQRAVRSLVPAFKGQDEYARGEAAMRLGEMGRIAVPVLLECLKDKDVDIRFKSLNALGVIGYVDSAVIDGISALFKDKQNFVRLKASTVLGDICGDNQSALPRLLSNMMSDDRDFLIGTIRALGNMGPAGEEAVPLLIQILKYENKKVREESVEALMKIGTLEAIEAAEQYTRQSIPQRQRR